MPLARSDVVVDRARQIADEVLFPTAQDVDRADTIPADHLAAIARAGLFDLAAAAAGGGFDDDRETAWRVFSTIAGGCGATFFVWAQHHTAVRVLRSSPNQPLVDQLLGELCSGVATAGVAFAHLRRSGPPAIGATRVDGGWLLDGHSPWTTSWGIADWFAIAGADDGRDDGQVVWAMLPRAPSDGVAATPLQLPVFMATGTVRLRFDRCFVPDERIALIEPLAEWRSRDRKNAAAGNPATHGIAVRATELVRELGEGDPLASAAADRLDDACRAREDAFDEILLAADLDDEESFVARASRHRTECLHLAQRATTALLATVGGRGMDLAHPAQRLAREADFFVIQAQTSDGRTAALRSV